MYLLWICVQFVRNLNASNQFPERMEKTSLIPLNYTNKRFNIRRINEKMWKKIMQTDHLNKFFRKIEKSLGFGSFCFWFSFVRFLYNWIGWIWFYISGEKIGLLWMFSAIWLLGLIKLVMFHIIIQIHILIRNMILMEKVIHVIR